jgi:hypothetical protein
VNAEQAQQIDARTPAMRISIPVWVKTEKGETLVPFEMDARTATMTATLAAPPVAVWVDPYLEALKTIEVTQPEAWTLGAMRSAPTHAAKRQALAALGKVETPDVRMALLETVRNDSLRHTLRIDAVNALAGFGSTDAQDAVLALARSQPGRFNYGSGGPGSSSHLTTEVLLRMAGVDIVHVPYKGLGPAVAALLGGQVQVLLVGMPNVMPQIRAGRLRALAVSTSKRSPFMPEVPTASEAGVPGYSAANWWGLWSPGGTSRTIVQRLNEEVARILQGAELRDRLAAEGAEPLGATPEAFARQVRDEIAFWRKVAREAGIRAE